MNRKHFWRLLIIVGLIAWSFYEMYPPTNQDLVKFFREKAVKRDETFGKIYTRALELQKASPAQAYENLQAAIGTNDITRYFPFFEAEKEAHPTTYILNRLQREAAGKIKLGLDLQGGVSILVRLDTNRVDASSNQVSQAQNNAMMSEAIEVLRKRVDQFGVAEPVLQPEGNDRIRIQLPGLSHAQMDQAIKTISKIAYLEFKLVHPESREILANNLPIPPGYQVLSSQRTGPNGEKITDTVVVKKRADMVGGIERAGLSRDNIGRPEILFNLDSKSADIFAKLTTANVGHQLAVILDGELQTAPNINSPITGGSGVIEGNYTDEEAQTLRNVLENPLKTPVKIDSSSEVDPTLGKDSIRSGIKASIIGVLLVAGFMLVYYMLAGLVADFALILNIIILVGVMCSVGTTFTLPGIAGVVLTIGMAVDANVLIFERIREESGKGKSLRGALQAGYDRAFGTIFDSHVTTLISSVILIFMGTGSVRGFGVALTIGVAASLFTALVVTRLIFDFLISQNWIKSLPMLHIIRVTKLDFMKLAIPAFIASWMLIVVGNSYGVFYRGKDVLGVEFTGGTMVQLSFDSQHKEEVEAIRKAVAAVVPGESLVSYQKDTASGRESLSITVRDLGKGGTQEAGLGMKIVDELKKDYPASQFSTLSIDHVGATVGEEIQQTAILASLLAMLGILFYVAFRYEFSFSVGAVIAIIHDIFMTLGCYFLAGRQLNATTVAAVLTIIGFSINDTIVIFDRIREDLRLGVRGSFRDIINQALNQTLSRTLITSGTVFLATISLYLFGGSVINDFAFAFLVGILTGTYSSIYIASAIVLWWHKGHRPKIGASQQVTAETAPAPVRG
ncbi:MAG: protein translocase subunit SecD [Verrucomicrobiota bacterium]